ncbi:MAG: helix-turn-helix domain-containing protein, partial [Acidimicrobiia bacterium]|nr:helix-turn-helix domain-containing protein [Acidimicrobiia bacterium]
MEQTTQTQSLPGFDTLDTAPQEQTRRTPPVPEKPGPTRKADNAPPRPLGEYPELMTVQETAEYLRIAPSTCYVLTKQYVDTRSDDGVPARKIGGRTMIHRNSLNLPGFHAGVV